MVAAEEWNWGEFFPDLLLGRKKISKVGLESDTKSPVPANTDETEGETSGDLEVVTDSTLITSIDDVKIRDSLTSNKGIGKTPFYYDSDGEDTGKTFITTTKQVYTEPVASIIPPSTPATTIAISQSTTTNKSTETFSTPKTTAVTSTTAEKPTPILPTQTTAATTKASTVASTMKPTLAVTLTDQRTMPKNTTQGGTTYRSFFSNYTRHLTPKQQLLYGLHAVLLVVITLVCIATCCRSDEAPGSSREGLVGPSFITPTKIDINDNQPSAIPNVWI